MNRQEFEHLRDLPDKEILDDIVFTQKDVRTTRSFQRIKIYNSLGIELTVDGSFVPDIPSLKFNFQISGIGPICRVEVNGKDHPPAGRTHKHALEDESSPRVNLPNPAPRPDLDLSKQSPREIWEQVCKEASIIHRGEFREPK